MGNATHVESVAGGVMLIQGPIMLESEEDADAAAEAAEVSWRDRFASDSVECWSSGSVDGCTAIAAAKLPCGDA